jgi:branched-chain amino acid transport system ATP-binding protein
MIFSTRKRDFVDALKSWKAGGMNHSSPETPLLEINNLTKDFHGLRALENYRLRLTEREILGVIGPNGAGKTTLFNLITGLILPSDGQVVYKGQDITRARPDKCAHLGIARTFQNIRLFNAMSTLDNVKVSEQMHKPVDPFRVIFSAPNFLQQENALEREAISILKTFGLEEYQSHAAGSLPYGYQRRLEIARALAMKPSLLLLDEPTVGMNPSESQGLLELIQSVYKDYLLTIILVAHDMRLVMGLCQRIQVLNHGQIIAEGDPESVRSHPDVIEAYLGKTQSHA